MSYSMIVFIYTIYVFMGVCGSICATRTALKEIGINEKYYPKHYILPGRKIRKLFGLNKREIPKWLYADFILPIIFILCLLAFLLVFSNMQNRLLVFHTFMRIYSVILVVYMLKYIICFLMFK